VVTRDFLYIEMPKEPRQVEQVQHVFLAFCQCKCVFRPSFWESYTNFPFLIYDLTGPGCLVVMTPNKNVFMHIEMPKEPSINSKFVCHCQPLTPYDEKVWIYLCLMSKGLTQLQKTVIKSETELFLCKNSVSVNGALDVISESLINFPFFIMLSCSHGGTLMFP